MERQREEEEEEEEEEEGMQRAPHPPLVCVISQGRAGYQGERVVVLCGGLTASSLLPPTAGEVLMEEDLGGEREREREIWSLCLNVRPVSERDSTSHFGMDVFICGVKKGQFHRVMPPTDRRAPCASCSLTCRSITVTQWFSGLLQISIKLLLDLWATSPPNSASLFLSLFLSSYLFLLCCVAWVKCVVFKSPRNTCLIRLLLLWVTGHYIFYSNWVISCETFMCRWRVLTKEGVNYNLVRF